MSDIALNQAERSALKAWPSDGAYTDAPDYLKPYWRQLNRYKLLDNDGKLTDDGRAERAK